MSEGVYNKAYKFRLLPNSEQITLFAKTFGCCRKIWNLMLGYTDSYYKEFGKTKYKTPAAFKKEAEFQYLKEVDALALCNVQLNLKKAYQAFFRKSAKFPRFKSRKDPWQSYTTNNQDASNAIRIEGNAIRLPKVGLVKFIQHRQLKACEKIKTCTISKAPSGKYYVSITVEGVSQIEQVKPHVDKVLGLDFAMNGLFVSSAGEIANYPRYYRRAEDKLHKLSRAVSRKKKGSSNRQKARLKLARWHESISNMRNDFLHKLTYQLASVYDAIAVEDINMRDMSQALRFGKSVADNGWGKFRQFLSYKLLDRGKQLITIDKWYPSSKTCSKCGTKNDGLQLTDRIYHCINEACNFEIDRDLNAAINIRTVGMTGIAW
jgi:putative transposase